MTSERDRKLSPRREARLVPSPFRATPTRLNALPNSEKFWRETQRIFKQEAFRSQVRGGSATYIVITDRSLSHNGVLSEAIAPQNTRLCCQIPSYARFPRR